MEFENKLKKKKPRVKWYEVVQSSTSLSYAFNKWYKTKSRKIKSRDRLGYSFLRFYLGLWFISYIRDLASDGKLDLEVDYVRRIAKTPWIVDLEDD